MRGVQNAIAPLVGQPTVVAALRTDGDANGRLFDRDGKTFLGHSPGWRYPRGRDEGTSEQRLALIRCPPGLMCSRC